MPFIDGKDWIRSAKQGKGPLPPMYLMSSFLLDTDYRTLVENQIDGVLLKEMSISAFREKLTNVFEKVGLPVT